MATANRIGTRVRRDRPPPKAVLGLGVGLLALNHLSVVLGNGLQLEALMMGCWLTVVGVWVLCAGRSFDAAWAWADASGRRIIGLVFLSMAAGFGAAEAVAWYGYGQHLFG
jgi:hypothetical protein